MRNPRPAAERTDDRAAAGKPARGGERVALGLVLAVFAGLSVLGSTWGLPGRAIDRYLFGAGEPWSGERIYRLAGAAEKFAPTRGADVDANPLDGSDGKPISLTATEEDVARIYLRYRLYTYQPDEMITMMALAGMRPGRLELDPRLYQYGGLFIYPVGVLIKVCGMLGLIDVRADVVYYLDNPDEFGKFYVVARAYSAAWGLLGVCVIFAIGRRLGGAGAGLLAALLFTLLPVVICMAHEGKPHLPGAVLMLLAVLFAMRHQSSRPACQIGESQGGESNLVNVAAPNAGATRDWWLMCVCCGAALGMVLSSWPIFVLIPLVALLDRRPSCAATAAATRGEDELIDPAGCSLQRFQSSDSRLNATPSPSENEKSRRLKPAARNTETENDLKHTAAKSVGGIAVAAMVYLAANPYILINALNNRDVLRSNFGNSLAMYEIAALGKGLVRVVELTVEGATFPVLVLGLAALIAAIGRKRGDAVPLAVAAGVFFAQFVLIGAGKPAEYGRFGVFTNAALAIGTACLLIRCRVILGRFAALIGTVAVFAWGAYCGGLYVANFRTDASAHNTRTALAETIQRTDGLGIAVLADPAPYGCPPLDFSARQVVLLHGGADIGNPSPDGGFVLITPVDQSGTSTLVSQSPDTPISWANKPFHVERWQVP